MKKKKKISMQQKESRRVQEAEKALGKSYTLNRQTPFVSVTKSNGPIHVQAAKETSYALPIIQIKKDLLGNVLFMVFSVGLLVVLRITNFGFEQLRPFLKF